MSPPGRLRPLILDRIVICLAVLGLFISVAAMAWALYRVLFFTCPELAC